MKACIAAKAAIGCQIVLGLICGVAPKMKAEPLCGTQANGREDAQAIPENRGIAALAVALQQLHTRASMLMIVAHPDDEDGATLAYESRAIGAQVGLLTLNRGEGGANEMSADLWDALGLVRTEELLQAGGITVYRSISRPQRTTVFQRLSMRPWISGDMTATYFLMSCE